MLRSVVIVLLKVGGAPKGPAGSDDDEDHQQDEKPHQDKAHRAQHSPGHIEHKRLPCIATVKSQWRFIRREL